MPTDLPAMPALSTDLLILGAFGLVTAYALIAGQGALIREAISIYVGLVLASAFGEPLYNYIQQSSGSGFGVNQTMVNLALFAIPIVVLQFAHPHMKTRHKPSMIITLILAVLTAMLLISSVLEQLSAVDLNRLTDESNLAAQIYSLRLVWLGVVPIAIAAAAVFRPKEKHR
jgi:hypothetical protein